MNMRQMRIAIGTYKAKVEGLEAEVRRKNKVLDQQRKDLESYSDNLGQHAEDYQDLEARNDAKIEEILQLQAAIGLNERILENVKNDRDGTNEALDRAVQRGQALLSERNNIRTLLDQKQARIDRMAHERDKGRRQLDACVLERGQALAELATIRKQLELRGLDLIDEKAVKNSALETLGTVGEERDLLAQELKLVAESNRIRGAKLAGAAQAGKEMRAKLEANENEIERLNYQLRKRIGEIAALRNERDENRELKEMRGERIDALVIERDDYARRSDQRAERIESLENDNEQLDYRIRELIGEIAALRDQRDTVVKASEGFLLKLDRRDAQIDKLRADIASMRGAFEGAMERAEDLRAELARAQHQTKIDPESHYLIDWDEGLVDISRSFAEWHLGLGSIPSGHTIGKRYEILSGRSVQTLIEPRFKMVIGFDTD